MDARPLSPAGSAPWLRGAAAVLVLFLVPSCSGSDRLRAGPGLWSDDGQTAHRSGPVVAVFEAADGNADGQLSPDEVTRFATARFAAADRDGDGELDLAELGLSGQPPEAQTLPFDGDGNGRMSLDEQLTYIRAVISDSTDTPSTVVHWLDVDRKLVR
ncbi:MAG: hypothetical protein RIB84_23115 [Sneathiellaceae bacterium]